MITGGVLQQSRTTRDKVGVEAGGRHLDEGRGGAWSCRVIILGWLLLRFGAPFLDGGVLGFFPRLVPLLPLTGHYLQQASVGRADLLHVAHLSRAHLVNAMLLKTCRCFALKLPLAGRQAHQDHGIARRSLSIGKSH